MRHPPLRYYLERVFRNGGGGYLALADVSDIFYFFFRSGGGRESEAAGREGGGRFLIGNLRGGRGSPRHAGPRGREGVCGELGIWGGGGKYFFSGRNVHKVALGR